MMHRPFVLAICCSFFVLASSTTKHYYAGFLTECRLNYQKWSNSENSYSKQQPVCLRHRMLENPYPVLVKG